MWIWDQSAGTLSRNGKIISKGYAGKGRGRNNPALQGERGIGPIPRGMWKIGAPYNSPNTGPYTMAVLAIDATPNNDTHDETGRGAFRIHGDNLTGTASQGCIILPRTIRQLIWQSGDRELKVVE